MTYVQGVHSDQIYIVKNYNMNGIPFESENANATSNYNY